jgi:TRAP-type uncharacterized transport system fused permease subunit
MVGNSLLIVGANWPDFILATATSLCSLFFLAMGIIGYLRGKLPPIERALLIIAALAMMIAPIGASVPGIAPLVAGTLMTLYHLRAKGDPVGANEAQARI